MFSQEKMAVLDSYQRKAKITTAILNSLDGVTCNDVTGSMYAFAKIDLPPKVIEEAKVGGKLIYNKPWQYYNEIYHQ